MTDTLDIERDRQARRKAEDHARRMIGDEFYFDDGERLKRVHERLLEMAAKSSCNKHA
jgi:hypothetical protein